VNGLRNFRIYHTSAGLSTLAGVVSDGFAPLIMVTLYKATQVSTGISIYISQALSVTLIALFSARETARRPLEE
jgi:hypothetical protein